MRYYFGFISFAFFGILLIVTPPSAQSQDEQRDGLEISAELLENFLEVQGVYEAVELTPIDNPSRSINAAADNCEDGAGLPDFSENNDTFLTSDITTVNGFGSETNDPNLSACFSSQAGSPVGYRSAWYQFIAPASGEMTVETVFSNTYAELYDTTIAVYSGDSCSALTLMTCNDDYNGLLSKTSSYVVEGTTYYIEIVDRNQALNGTANANVLVTINSADYWLTDGDWNTNAAFRSRHATAVVDDEIYVIGGQTVVNGITPQRTGRVDKFNTTTGEWTALPNFPSFCAGDTNGYSNTSATYVEYVEGSTGETRRRIFLPSGYIGDDGDYADTHCVYDIDSNSWQTAATAPWTSSAPAFASTTARNFSPVGYYVTGGLTGAWGQEGGDGANGTDVLLYLPQSNSWFLDANAALEGGRFAHVSGIISDRYLCVMGGLANPDSSNPAAIILVNGGECLDLFDVSSGWDPIPATNIPRFQASSAIGPDGRWYVWGGVTIGGAGSLVAVAEMESYGPGDTDWEILDNRYDLNQPARSWARGGFVDNNLYVIGGETDYVISNGDPKYQAGITPIVEALTFPAFPLANSYYLPVVLYNAISAESGLSGQATAAALGGTYYNNFNDVSDVFDVYEFSLSTVKNVRIILDQIPDNDNYNLYLYDADKVLLASSDNIGTLEDRIDEALTAGSYYVFIVAEQNDSFTQGNYRLRLVEP